MDSKLEIVKRKLIQNSFIREGELISFVPSYGSFLRLDDQETHKFRIEVGGIPKYFLRIGKGLKWLKEKYELLSVFQGIYPCIIIFFTESGEDFLLEEFIEGDTIEKILDKNPERKNEMIEKVKLFHDELNKSCKVSTYENAKLELESLVKKVTSFRFVTNLDTILIQSISQPEIIKLLSNRDSFYKRLTQGDFIDRNIIIASSGQFKIGDLEFTHETHFFEEELIRFFSFSSSIKGFKLNLPKYDPLSEIYFNLNQMKLVGENHKEFITPPSFNHHLKEIMRILKDNSESFEYSRMIEVFCDELQNSLQSNYNSLQSNYNSVVNSCTWKIGRIFTKPFQIIFSFFRK